LAILDSPDHGFFLFMSMFVCACVLSETRVLVSIDLV